MAPPRAERDRGVEYLDDPDISQAVAARSLRDVALANRLFGGTRAMLSEVRQVFREQRDRGTRQLTLLDIGTGLGDIPVFLVKNATKFGIQVRAIGLEISEPMARVARPSGIPVLAADARALPFGDNSIDIITCSLVLHHLDDREALRMLRECSRVARTAVIVADLQRSVVAMALLWIVSFPLRFHPISRHDGVVSIRRGYSPAELSALVASTTSAAVRCRRRWGWRVTAAWKPGTIPHSILPPAPTIT